MKKLVAVGESGLRIGEDHPRAKLSNHDVDKLLELHDEGWGYQSLADKFEICKSQARNICKGRKRCQSIAGFRYVNVPDK